ncbi:MAG: hypothetical protein R3F24_06725 [Gammaproteobacteria bacterium]
MNGDQENRPPRISIPMRVIAGLLAIGIALAAVDGRQTIIRSEEFVGSAFQIAAFIVVFLLFAYTSIVGKQPGWLDRFSNAVDRELIRDSAGGNGSWTSEAPVIVGVGAILGLMLYFLANDYAFEMKNNRRWIAYCVFLLVWFAMVGPFIWYAKYSLKRRIDKSDGDISGENN